MRKEAEAEGTVSTPFKMCFGSFQITVGGGMGRGNFIWNTVKLAFVG